MVKPGSFHWEGEAKIPMEQESFLVLVDKFLGPRRLVYHTHITFLDWGGGAACPLAKLLVLI